MGICLIWKKKKWQKLNAKTDDSSVSLLSRMEYHRCCVSTTQHSTSPQPPFLTGVTHSFGDALCPESNPVDHDFTSSSWHWNSFVYTNQVSNSPSCELYSPIRVTFIWNLLDVAICRCGHAIMIFPPLKETNHGMKLTLKGKTVSKNKWILAS